MERPTFILQGHDYPNNKSIEIYRQISLMNTDVKILSKILANQTQGYIKRNIQHNQVRNIQGHKDGSISGNQCDTPHDYIKKCRKRSNKIQHSFTIKFLIKVGIEGTYHSIIKAAQLTLYTTVKS